MMLMQIYDRPPRTWHGRSVYQRVFQPDLETTKDFLRFYISTSRPVISTKPTVDSINTVAEWFFAGFTCVTGTETIEADRKEVYNVRDHINLRRVMLIFAVGAKGSNSGGDRRKPASP